MFNENVLISPILCIAKKPGNPPPEITKRILLERKKKYLNNNIYTL